MCWFQLLVLALASVTCMGVGDDPEIRSPAVRTAIAKCDSAIADAERAARRAETQALNELITALEKAKTAAMKVADLPEANALDHKIKQTRDRIEELNAPVPKPMRFDVFGNKGWQMLGRVEKGQKLHITVEGKWTDDIHKPELLCGISGGRFRLIAQINGDHSFPVGSQLDLLVPETGNIEFGMADSGHINGGGKLTITVTLQK